MFEIYIYIYVYIKNCGGQKHDLEILMNIVEFPAQEDVGQLVWDLEIMTTDYSKVEFI